MARAMRAAPDARARAAALLLVFAACGAGLVIAASLRFGGVETGSHRQAMQYAWALLLAGGILFDRQSVGRAWPALVTTAVLLFAFRTYDFAKRTTTRALSPDHTLVIAADTQLRAAVRLLEAEGAFLVSNTPWIFRVEDDASVRQLIGCNFETEQLQALEKLQSRGRAVSLVLTNGGSDGECLSRWRTLLQTSTFRRAVAFHTGVIVSARSADTLRPAGTP